MRPSSARPAPRLAEAADARAAARVARERTLLAAGARHPDRSHASRYDRELTLVVDRPAAATGAWYELFPRSQGREAGRATTLPEAEWRLPELRRLGFDVIYLPPIHPIGSTNRKGRNNAERARPGDVGSPWAVGSDAGGHEAVATELGGLEGFLHFKRAAERQGMEVALDLAIQASPDHPWVRSTPTGFVMAPTGRSATPRTRPSATRTCTRSTFMPPIRRHAPSCGTPGDRWS